MRHMMLGFQMKIHLVENVPKRVFFITHSVNKWKEAEKKSTWLAEHE